MPRALGLMSGTSADGIGLALIEDRPTVRVLDYATYAYPAVLRARILASPHLLPGGLAELDFDLGRTFARAARRFLKGRRVLTAGSHGQTVVHRPGLSTLQIGEPAFLAEALGVPVVSDFRPRDIAMGGQGAPIVPFFDEVLFGQGPPSILQNIGGIANAAIVGRGVKTAAFDTGPGNSLIDIAVRRMTRGKMDFDKGGRIARRGRYDPACALRLLRAPFFSQSPPKSLDRSSFSERYFRRRFPAGRRRPEDVVATVTYFTALSIAYAYRLCLPMDRVARVIVSGGGVLNPVLMGHLRRLLDPLPVLSIADFGIAPEAKEPAAIALMALYALRGKSNHCPAATGAAAKRVLGKITPF